MAAHKFSVGQRVFYTGGMVGRSSGNGTYQVVRLLPSDGSDYHYRIKSMGEAYERVAKESQLERDH